MTRRDRPIPGTPRAWFGSHAPGEQLNALLEAASEHSIIATDLVGLVTVFSAGAERLLGYKAKDIVGLRTPAMFHDNGEVAERARELGCAAGFDVFVHAARLGGVETRDWTYINRSGHRMTVSLSVTGIRDDRGRLVGFIGIATDVTLGRSAHRAVIAQRETYHALIKNIPFTSVGLADADLQWVTLSGYSVAMSGLTEAHFLGKPVGCTLARQDADTLRSMLRGVESAPVHADLKTVDGRWFEIDAVALPQPDAATDAHVLVVVRDATERRAAERAMRSRERALAVNDNSFKAAFDEAPSPAALVEAQGPDQPGRFARVNRAFASILGYAPAQLVGAVVSDLVHADDQDVLAAAGSAPLRLRHATGRWIWVEIVRANVTDADGTMSLRVEHIVDLTARLAQDQALLDALEQRRVALARQEELERVRTDMISNMSHELRSPITSIRGYLELILDDPTTPLTASHRQMLDVAIKNVARLEQTTSDLLTIARAEAVGSDLSSMQTIDLAQVLSDVVDEIQPANPTAGSVIALEIPDRPVEVTADRDQIYRAVSNLVSNALRYGGTDAYVRITLEVGDGRAVLSVEDNGIGIPAAEREQVFTRFYRATSARQAGISGTGLGLAITRTIIENHGGTVVIDDKAHEGTRVLLTLPTGTERQINAAPTT